MQRGGGGALAHAGLQHPQLALLDGEFDIAHVAIVVLEGDEDLFELGARLLQALDVLELCDGARIANARDDVFTLGIDQVVAVEFLLAVGGIAREGDAGRRRLALVAEHHGLHVDGRAQIVGDLVLLAIQRGARIVPAAEHGFDGQTQLRIGILREADLAAFDQRRVIVGGNVLGEDRLELLDELLQILGGQIRVAFHAAHDLFGVDGVFEQVAVKTHDHVGEHLDEAAIAVPRETRVFGMLDQTR